MDSAQERVEAPKPPIEIPDPISFLQNEPPEIKNYRMQGLRTGFSDDNNFHTFFEYLARQELINAGMMNEKSLGFIYEMYKEKAKDPDSKHAKVFAALTNLNESDPVLHKYLMDAMLVKIFTKLHTGLHETALQPEYRHIMFDNLRKVKEWESENNEDFAKSFLETYRPVMVHALHRVSELTGISIVDLMI